MRNLVCYFIGSFCIAGGVGATTVVEPDCVIDEVAYYHEGDYIGDLRMALGHSIHSKKAQWLLLSHCPSKTQLKMLAISADSSTPDVDAIRDDVVELIASNEKYTFQDVVDRYSNDVAVADVVSIQPNSCICKIEVE